VTRNTFPSILRLRTKSLLLLCQCRVSLTNVLYESKKRSCFRQATFRGIPSGASHNARCIFKAGMMRLGYRRPALPCRQRRPTPAHPWTLPTASSTSTSAFDGLLCSCSALHYGFDRIVGGFLSLPSEFESLRGTYLQRHQHIDTLTGCGRASHNSNDWL
jgi:hypothetical protein